MYCNGSPVVVVLAILSLDIISAQDIDYEIDAVVGYSAELPCNVTAEIKSDKLYILAWYNPSTVGSSTDAFYSRDLRSEEDGESGDIASVDGPGGRYQLVADDDQGINYLRIDPVKTSDASIYYCLADFEASPSHKTYVKLNVIEPPERLWIIYENGTRVATASAGSNASHNIGPYYVGDTVHLFCVAFGGNPLANMTWWADQKQLKDTSTPLSVQRIRSDLEHGPLTREDHGTVLTCMANNNNETLPLVIDVIVDMFLPPELVSVRDMNATTDGSVAVGRVRAGQILYLQCRVLGARPTPAIQWRLDDDELQLEQNIINEPSQRLVVSEVQVKIKEGHDESRITCCAPSNEREEDSLTCAQAMPLTVLYAPVVHILADAKVENNTLTIVKGTDLALNCTYTANPSVYQVMWFHEDDIITHDGEDTPLQPILQLRNLTETDSGEYVCAAANDEGSAYSEPFVVDVIYPAYCEDESIAEYGVGEGEAINITCNVKGNPEPTGYRWIIVNEATDVATFRPAQPHNTKETSDKVLEYHRPNGTAFNTIFCWGQNEVLDTKLPYTPCTFRITDETVPRPPSDCKAVKALGEISIECEPGHDGGLPQKFKFSVNELDSEDEIVSIVSLEPKFIIQEPKQENYKFVIVAINDKGESNVVEIEQDSVIDEDTDTIDDNLTKTTVTNITTLALALFGGVLLVALAACGLVLCAHEKEDRAILSLPRDASDPPLCAYNTEESNCETYHDSDDNSECNIRRTESFRRAMARYPSSKNYDVRRTSSFHSARYMNDMIDQDSNKCSDILRHSASCRVHSLQNISRKREMEAACDHLIMHLPPETNYQVARPMNSFYTMPRKMRNRSTRQINDDASEITQTSDGFSLPPPPDEFGTYRAASRIKDIPAKTAPTYTTIKKSPKIPPKKYNNDVIISPMNTVGLPTISGKQNSVYSYPDDDHHASTNPFDDSP